MHGFGLSTAETEYIGPITDFQKTIESEVQHVCIYVQYNMKVCILFGVNSKNGRFPIILNEIYKNIGCTSMQRGHHVGWNSCQLPGNSCQLVVPYLGTQTRTYVCQDEVGVQIQPVNNWSRLAASQLISRSVRHIYEQSLLLFSQLLSSLVLLFTGYMCTAY